MGRDEVNQLNYVKWNDLFLREKPYQVIADLDSEALDSDHPAKSFATTNIEFEYGAAQTIHDIRGRENEFNLRDHAFQICQRPMQLDSVNPRYVDSVYVPQVEALLRDIVPNVVKVMVFDWRVS